MQTKRPGRSAATVATLLLLAWSAGTARSAPDRTPPGAPATSPWFGERVHTPGPCGLWDSRLTTEPGPGDADFPAGIAVGAVRADRATIVVHAAHAGRARVLYSAGPDCAETVSKAIALDEDNSRTGQITLADLGPSTIYRYRVELDEGAGPSAPGWFYTAPLTDWPFRIAWSADISEKEFLYGPLDDLAASGADFFVSLGDWPYRDAGIPARTLGDFRFRYVLSRLHPSVRALLRAMPIHGVWDDHEVVNDWDGQIGAEAPQKVAAGKRAWREWFPVADAPEGEIYRSHRWGPNVELFYLDTRSHRSSNVAADDGDKTMLGRAQLRWLLDALSASNAEFKLIFTSVPLDYGTTGKDHWIGFLRERDTLLDHIVEGGIRGVVFLTADQHWMAVHHLQNGLKEFQTGALAQTPRVPSEDVPPWVLDQRAVLNYGLVDYLPGAPPRLRISIWADDGERLYEEEIAAGRGSLSVCASSPYMRWRITGAHTFFGTGSRDFPLAPPGRYRIDWDPALPGRPLPDPTLLEVSDGKTVIVDDGAEDLSEMSFFDDFERDDPGPGWVVMEQGVTDPTASWLVEGGAVREAGNTFDYNGDESVVDKLGTYLWAPAGRFDEGLLAARIYPGDNDSYGLMYGIHGPQTYYRASFDHDRSYARLVRSDAGAMTVLAEDTDYRPPMETWMTVAIERNGGVHSVYVDGELILSASDDTYPGGTIGLYTWAMFDARFDDVAVLPR